MDYYALRQIFTFGIGKDINNIADREKVAEIVIRHDLMWRTEAGMGSFRSINRNYDSRIISVTADIVYKFLTGPCPGSQTDYDTWHRKACNKILTEYNNIFSTLGAVHTDGSPIQLLYGRAQKAINMTLKNFVVMDNAAVYLNHCKYAHMPVDSQVINWLNRHGCKVGNPSWTKLDYANYMRIQNMVRSYVPTNSSMISADYSRRYPYVSTAGFTSPLTVFEAEFLIWA